MSDCNKNNCHKSKIGGQALIEGIMMRGIDKASMAVRLPNKEIDVETWDIVSLKDKKWYLKTPIIRGTFNFIESMVMGYKCLMKSAEKSMTEEEKENEKPGKFEQFLIDKFGDKMTNAIMIVAMVIGVVISVGLFMYLPALLVSLLGKVVTLGRFGAVVEGLIKIIIFIVYLSLVSTMKEIRRVYEYHGAEHKTIACYEAGEELNVENVKKYTRFHPRCGTSFIIISLVLSILVFSVVTWSSPLIRTVIKIALLPVVIGIAYELIKLAGRYDNWFTKIISAPGLYLQRLTTREPDESQIEIAIAAMTPVIPQDRTDDQW